MLTIDQPDLADRAEAMSNDELDRLPFGVIHLDHDGKVLVYTETERRLSGYDKRPPLGLDFFLTVAPCMNTPAFRGRVDAARARGSVDIEMSWIGDYDDRSRESNVRVVSASDGGLWIFNSREG